MAPPPAVDSRERSVLARASGHPHQSPDGPVALVLQRIWNFSSCKFSCDRGGQDGKLSYHIFGEIQKHFAGGEGMAKIKITIQDDFGKVITETADREYQLDLGKATLTEIEGAVEDFKKRALADIEKDFLHDAQTRFVQEQKKEEWSSVMGQQPSLSRHYTASFPLPSND